MMSFNLDSQTYGPLLFKPVVPASLAKWIVPGSHPYIAKGKFGHILLQQIDIGDIQLIYTVAHIREDLALDFTINQPQWLMHIALKNENRLDINDAEPLNFKQGQFNMVRSALLKGTFYLDGGQDYRMLTISYSQEQLEKMHPIFPFLHGFTRDMNRYPSILFRSHHWINARIMDIIDHLLNCTYRSSLRKVYFDYKSKELLFLLLGREQEEILEIQGISDHTIAAINEARYIMDTEHNVPLTRIARQVGISEVKLKNGLKLLYGL